jgi:prolyl 4-hydroxylase
MTNRCPPLASDVPQALYPGDLNKMFERIVDEAPGNQTLTAEMQRKLDDDKMPAYTVQVLSRPSQEPASEVSIVNDKSLPPWLVVFDNFITDDECEAMIQLGYKYEYQRSEDVGARKFDGTHDSVKSRDRTSENAWCSEFSGCRDQEIPSRIMARMGTVMGIPPQNSEDLQLLKYEKGQFYRTHHDYIDHQIDRQCGPRILTFFIYLSDVEAGGKFALSVCASVYRSARILTLLAHHALFFMRFQQTGGTNFPNLDITVMPKKGRAVLWPSVFDSYPLKKDGRFLHQALDVEAGVKFAANIWIHMFDHVTPQKSGCT